MPLKKILKNNINIWREKIISCGMCIPMLLGISYQFFLIFSLLTNRCQRCLSTDDIFGIGHILQTGIPSVFATEIVRYSVLECILNRYRRQLIPIQPTEIRLKTDLEHRLNQLRISVEKATLHSVDYYQNKNYT